MRTSFRTVVDTPSILSGLRRNPPARTMDHAINLSGGHVDGGGNTRYFSERSSYGLWCRY